MGFNCGIVGLPNVGKSTIFSALTATSVDAANYPFCTIEPNTGVVPVPDARINVLAGIAKSKEIIPTTIEFVDIAGLVKGASEGEGLGNQFLGNIRTVDAVVHVVRCFSDEEVTHVDGSLSPKRDIEIIETELLLADLAVVERRIDKVARQAKSGDKALQAELAALEQAKAELDAGRELRHMDGLPELSELLKGLGLITAKPLLYLGNVDESQAAFDPQQIDSGAEVDPLVRELVETARERKAEVVLISGKVESEIAALEEEERRMFLEELGLELSGLDRLAVSGYKLLDLITFFTIGPKEARAWTCRNGTPAVDAAGIIHSDFAKGFIRAEVISYGAYVSCKGEQGAKEKGELRLEGKSYSMKDGDVVHFRFNV